MKIATPLLKTRDGLEGFEMRIEVLTGGGDCPGLNAVTRLLKVTLVLD